MEKRWIWPFELEEQLGAGGMGVVYKARYVGNNRRVALKLLPKHIAANPVLSARFERELEILKDLKHPHVVHCFGGTCEGDQWFYAMELVEGGTVDALLKERGKFTWERTIEYGVQICAALTHAHAKGIVHRDLKPANLLLTKTGKVKLSDFGLALVEDGEKLTAAGKTLGTFHYMSPELITGSPPLSSRSDLYALGCVLYEFLAGEPPFKGQNAGEILNRHLVDPPPRVTRLALDCPPALETIILDLLQKAPADRPATAEIVATRLKQIEQTVTVKNPRGYRELEKTAPKVAAHPAPTATSIRRATNWPLAASLFAVLALCLWSVISASEHRLFVQAEGLWVAALSDTNPAVRMAAVHSLQKLGPAAEQAGPGLAHTLGDSDLEVRRAAALALGNLGAAARPALAALVIAERQDTDQTVREHAAKSLEKIRDVGYRPSMGMVLGVLACGALLMTLAWNWLKRLGPQEIVAPPPTPHSMSLAR